MKKLHKLCFVLFIAIFVIPLVTAQMTEDCMGKHIIWSNFPLMYALDIIIIIAAIFAVYIGQQMLSRELKSVFMYIFVGMMLIALHYLLDLYAMLTNNMVMMTFVYMDLFWVLNVMAFILFVMGFYKMNALFRKIAK